MDNIVLKYLDMSIGEFLNSVFENFKDRVKTPITGAYTISFIIYNWRPIVYLLFSEDTMAFKIEHIDMHFHTIWAVLGPLIMAIVYVLGVPYVMMWIERVSKFANIERKKFKYENDEDDLKFQIDMAKFQYEIDQAKNGSKKEEEIKVQIESLNAQNESLTQQLKINNDNLKSATINYQMAEAKLSKEIADLYDKSNESINKLMRVEESVALIISNMEESSIMEFVDYAKLKIDNKKVRISLGQVKEFSKIGFITNWNENAEISLELTELGLIAYKLLTNVSLNMTGRPGSNELLE